MIFKNPIEQLSGLGFNQRKHSTINEQMIACSGIDGLSWTTLAKRFYTLSQSCVYSEMPHGTRIL